VLIIVSLQSAGNVPDAKFDGKHAAGVSAETAIGSIEWSGGDTGRSYGRCPRQLDGPLDDARLVAILQLIDVATCRP